jgi:pectate lyase
MRWQLLGILALLSLFITVMPLVTYGATLFSDTFEDGVADGWSTNGGSWAVVTDGSQVYRQSSTSSTALALAGATTWTDQVVEARVKAIQFVGSSEYVAIAARVQNATNYYYLSLRDANKLELNKVVAGSKRSLASTSFTVNTNTWYTLRLEIQGSTLRGFVNGTQHLSVTDSQFTSGRAGVTTYNASASFDDVLVTTPGSSPQPTPTSTSAPSDPTATPTPTAVPTTGPTPTPGTPTTGLVGFATVNALGQNGTTGGARGQTVTVSNASDFLAAVQRTDPVIVQVNGTINLTGMNKVASDKTIIGVGTSGVITGGGLTLSGVKNVIIRNLTFTNANDDSINIESGSHHIWVDHNDLSNGYDGLVDIKRGSDFITVSWNYFHHHDKTALLGHDDANSAQDRGHLRVTYHHNWFSGTVQRHPRVRFGDPVHVFNNYYVGNSGYGIASTMDAGVLVEGNYFDGVANPMITQTGSSDPGRIVQRNNVFVNSGTPQTSGSVADPGSYYSYTLDDPNTIPAIVSGGAGVGKISP